MDNTTNMMSEQFRPTLDEFRALARGPANLIPVTREFAADLETPVSVYLKPVSYTHLDVYKRQLPLTFKYLIDEDSE